jgi:murein DD-endopeptidase MepM/ murein hydrolase activator NlpD
MISFVAATGAAGFWLGQVYADIRTSTTGTLAALGAMFERERAALNKIKEESLSHLDAVGGRLGQMQAEILRLNALGARLVQMAGLSDEEFDFENPPAVGGPEPLEAAEELHLELTDEMNRLFSELQDRDRKLSLLEQLIMERELEEQIMPAGSPVLSGFVTSKFGFRKDPFNGKGSFHRGVDFAGKRGTPVIAVADGLVVLAESRSGYGRTVEIHHGNGLVTRYAHNQKLLVKEGDLVEQGQTIATLGSSGRATGPHLHFEVLEGGEQVDPMKYVGTKKRDPKG